MTKVYHLIIFALHSGGVIANEVNSEAWLLLQCSWKQILI